MAKFSLIVGLCLLLVLPACTEQPLTREDEIKRYIETGVEAAEDRSHSDIADLIDSDYRGQKGFDKKKITALLRAYFFRHQNINLFTKIDEISFPADDQAYVTLYVAMTGSVITDASLLASLRAKIYQFELLLVKRDVWLLQQANWQAASIADMQ